MCNNMTISSDIKIIAFLALLFIVWPFGAFVLCLFLLSKVRAGKDCVIFSCIFFVSMYWGLLAFTQKSLAFGDTDCITYYNRLLQFENADLCSVIERFDFLNLVNFIFYPVSAYVVAFSGNVQSVSFLWVSFTYFLTYYSIWRLLEYYNLDAKSYLSFFIIAVTCCFMVFVQISELLKNASAFALFFFGFTLFLEKGINKWSFLLFIISVGLHPSVIMLSPLYFYKLFNNKLLAIISILIIPIAMAINIFDVILNYIPGGAYFSLLSDRFSSDFEQSGSIHYVLKILILEVLALWLLLRTWGCGNKICNIVFLYIIIASFNYVNLTAYVRFALFSHYLFALLLIQFVLLGKRRFDLVVKSCVMLMLLLTFRFSLGRITPGGYTSSYMNNSLTEIVFSTSFDYLNVDFEK